MSFLFQPLHVFVAVLIEYVRKQQEMVIEYLQVENQVLREQIGGNRVLLTHDQRRLLAVKGKALGRKQLEKVATIAQADTILRWHRELIQPTGDSKPSSNIGRPRKSQEVVNLVRRMARENVIWGYKRIEGAMHNLGYSVCSSTVANILKQHGIDPAPSRQRTTSWSTFFKAHWDVFEGIDLHDIRLWIIEWLNGLFGIPSYSEAIPIVAETSQKATQETPKSIRINILEVADTEIHLARAPPSPAGPLPSVLTRDIRRAA
ncbi:MAG: hypothetical protein CMJ50_08340 [Planctomycetaceae bacterium]|nr:hypothetical protein [Planctomycetaceae bacterium]